MNLLLSSGGLGAAGAALGLGGVGGGVGGGSGGSGSNPPTLPPPPLPPASERASLAKLYDGRIHVPLNIIQTHFGTEGEQRYERDHISKFKGRFNQSTS
jgi:hypothetical protein